MGPGAVAYGPAEEHGGPGWLSRDRLEYLRLLLTVGLLLLAFPLVLWRVWADPSAAAKSAVHGAAAR